MFLLTPSPILRISLQHPCNDNVNDINTMDTYGYYNGYIWILQWIQPAPNVYYADAMPDVEALMQVCILVLLCCCCVPSVVVAMIPYSQYYIFYVIFYLLSKYLQVVWSVYSPLCLPAPDAPPPLSPLSPLSTLSIPPSLHTSFFILFIRCGLMTWRSSCKAG